MHSSSEDCHAHTATVTTSDRVCVSTTLKAVSTQKVDLEILCLSGAYSVRQIRKSTLESAKTAKKGSNAGEKSQVGGANTNVTSLSQLQGRFSPFRSRLIIVTGQLRITLHKMETEKIAPEAGRVTSHLSWPRPPAISLLRWSPFSRFSRSPMWIFGFGAANMPG